MKPIHTSLFVASILTSAASGAVTFNNITGATSSSTELVSGPMTFDMTENAVAFEVTTDSQTWILDSVELGFGPNTQGSTGLQIDLYTSGNPITGAPFSAIIPLVGNLNPFSNETYTTGATTINLAPNSSFWIHIYEPAGDGEFEVKTESNSAGTGTWSITDRQLNLSGSWSTAGTTPEVRFNATAVPEPSAALLGLVGLARKKR